MSIWAIAVGYFSHILPTAAIIVGPFLAVLGGECVLQSTVFALTSALASGYVQRYVLGSLRLSMVCKSHPRQGILLLVRQLYFVCRIIPGPDFGFCHDDLESLAAFLAQHRPSDVRNTHCHAVACYHKANACRIFSKPVREP